VKKLFSSFLLVLTALIWGFAFVAQDSLGGLGALTIGAVRSIFAGVFLIFVIMALDRLLGTGRKLFSKKGIDFNRYELIGGAICGAVLAVATLFQQSGINAGTDGGKAAFITALYVVLVPVYSLALKKKAPFNVWISIGISVIGFYLLCVKENTGIAASDLLVLISSLIFPVHILVIDYFSPRCDGVRMSCIQFFVAFVINTVFALIFESPVDFSAISVSLAPLIYLGVASSGIAYTLQIIGQRNVDPSVASILLSLESVFGVLGTAIILGSRLEPREYIGSSIVFVAVVLSQLDFKSYKKQK